ncbi:MAG: alanyl-tRNA editing protein [Candidatus Micrarchaeota archaeon]
MLCLENSYQKECDALVMSANSKKVVLDTNLFYPRGGGQPCDTGMLMVTFGGDTNTPVDMPVNIFRVLSVSKVDGQIVHELDREGIHSNQKVKCVLDWDRRYKLMRSHTAAHALAGTMSKELGCLITGNQIEEDKVRFDFNLENFERDKFDAIVQKVNGFLKQDVELKVYSLPREEAMKIEGVVKLANALPPSITVLRIVEIPGLDIQADGGTHVKNLNEVGQIEIMKLENKGKENRRIYFKLI